jgi:hypothetical protein
VDPCATVNRRGFILLERNKCMRRSTLQHNASSMVAQSLFDNGWMTIRELYQDTDLETSRVRRGLETLRSDRLLEIRPRDEMCNEHRLTHRHSQEEIKSELE